MDEDERLQLLKWIDENLKNFIQLPNNRLWCDISKSTIPECVWDIKKRLIEKEGLLNCMHDMDNRDFISIILPNGFIHKHIDGNFGELIHCRYNFFIELPSSGGETYYNNSLVDTQLGKYVLLKAGIHMHWTTPVVRGRRITLSFGFYIPSK